MSEDMRMSDVWNKPLTYGVYDDATVEGNKLPSGLYGMLFNNEEPARAVCYAVNSHDSMLDRIAQLESELQAKTDFLALVVEEKQKFIDDKAELVEALTSVKSMINTIGNIHFVEDYSAREKEIRMKVLFDIYGNSLFTKVKNLLERLK